MKDEVSWKLCRFLLYVSGLVIMTQPLRMLLGYVRATEEFNDVKENCPIFKVVLCFVRPFFHEENEGKK